MLNVELQNFGEAAVLHCRGQLVHGRETKLLCAALGCFGRDVIVDLKEVESIDSAGMGALIALQAAGVYLKLQDPRPRVREQLFSKGLDSMFEIFETDLPQSKNRFLYSCPAA